MTDVEAREQRRLVREARDRRLGVLRHPDLPAGELEPESWDTAVVEVTIRRVAGAELEAGFYETLVPRLSGDDIGSHPATLAHDAVYDHLAAKEYEWFQIADVRSH